MVYAMINPNMTKTFSILKNFQSSLLIPIVLIFVGTGFGQPYSWSVKTDSQPLSRRILPPTGYKRISLATGSFAAWLRELPIKTGNPPVYLFNGQLKENQDAHHAVVDIDVGKEDLQQCADAIMRLRAEYLFSSEKQENICFRFTSGDKAEWTKWREGYRPHMKGNSIKWVKNAKPDSTHNNFRAYLTEVDRWAGTASISKELVKVADSKRIEIGDVFIKGGFPGHAVLVVDVAEDASGRRVFLLAQSYMPAQDIHILKNPTSDVSPWYSADDSSDLITPEWTFARNSLKRFSDDGCPNFR